MRTDITSLLASNADITGIVFSNTSFILEDLKDSPVVIFLVRAKPKTSIYMFIVVECIIEVK